jgi:hypothetical protein
LDLDVFEQPVSSDFSGHLLEWDSQRFVDSPFKHCYSLNDDGMPEFLGAAAWISVVG